VAASRAAAAAIRDRRPTSARIQADAQAFTQASSSTSAATRPAGPEQALTLEHVGEQGVASAHERALEGQLRAEQEAGGERQRERPDRRRLSTLGERRKAGAPDPEADDADDRRCEGQRCDEASGLLRAAATRAPMPFSLVA
jgi:hypothetical protein